MARAVTVLAAIIVAGVPLLAYIWGTLNVLFAGHIDGRRLAITAPVVLVFAGLLVLAGRTLSRLAAPPPGAATAEPEPAVAGTLFLTALVAIVMFSLWLLGYTYLLNR